MPDKLAQPIPENIREAVGQRFWEARQNAPAGKIAQEVLGYSTPNHSAVRRLETGDWGVITWEHMIRLADHYGKPLEYFLGEVTLDEVEAHGALRVAEAQFTSGKARAARGMQDQGPAIDVPVQGQVSRTVSAEADQPDAQARPEPGVVNSSSLDLAPVRDIEAGSAGGHPVEVLVAGQEPAEQPASGLADAPAAEEVPSRAVTAAVEAPAALDAVAPEQPEAREAVPVLETPPSPAEAVVGLDAAVPDALASSNSEKPAEPAVDAAPPPRAIDAGPARASQEQPAASKETDEPPELLSTQSRLAFLRKKILGLSPKDFAKKLTSVNPAVPVTERLVQDWEGARMRASDSHLDSVVKLTGVPKLWVKTGRGPAPNNLN